MITVLLAEETTVRAIGSLYSSRGLCGSHSHGPWPAWPEPIRAAGRDGVPVLICSQPLLQAGGDTAVMAATLPCAIALIRRQIFQRRCSLRCLQLLQELREIAPLAVLPAHEPCRQDRELPGLQKLGRKALFL